MSDDQTEVAAVALRLVALAETLELMPRSPAGGVDRNRMSAALEAFASAGVARRTAELRHRVTPARLADILRKALRAIEESPLPGHEWEPLTKLLGEEPLARLVGTSVSSVHRYRTSQRPTPDDVAARLHEIALIAADLGGSYNDFGIRRWFDRRRSALDGAAPADILVGQWSPDDDRVLEVRALARALSSSPAT